MSQNFDFDGTPITLGSVANFDFEVDGALALPYQEVPSTDLEFWDTLVNNHVVFGKSKDTLVPTVDLAVVATFPGLTVTGLVAPTIYAEGGALLNGLTVQTTGSIATVGTVVATLPGLSAQGYIIPTVQAAVGAMLPDLKVSGVIAPTAFAEVEVVFPQLTVLVDAREVREVQIVAQMPMLEVMAISSYKSNAARPTVCSIGSSYQTASLLEEDRFSKFNQATSFLTENGIPWEEASKLETGILHPLPKVLKRCHIPEENRYSEASRLSDGSVEVLYQDGTRLGVWRGTNFTKANPYVTKSYVGRHQEATRLKSWDFVAAWVEATLRVVGVVTTFGSATGLHKVFRGRYQEASKPPIGRQDWVPPVDPPVIPKEYPGDLIFDRPYPSSLDLIFGYKSVPIPEELTKVIPVRKVYIVLNEVRVWTATHWVKNVNNELPVTSMSLDLDVGSWAWGFNLSLPKDYYPYLASQNTVQLIASVNGEVFHLLGEKLSRNKAFGATSITLSGRSKSALLSSPYCMQNNYTPPTGGLDSDALMASCLTSNGVPMQTDDGVEWSIVCGDDLKWFVPENTPWSVQGTPIDGVVSVANAVGAFVYPHPSLPRLEIKRKYPYLPWEWGTLIDGNPIPFRTIPPEFVETEGVSWEKNPLYDGVFVSGTSVGGRARVQRGASDPVNMAQAITDPLITRELAARRRGESILVKTGEIASVSLSLPVVADYGGIIKPGSLVKYTENGGDMKGVTTKVSISCQGNAKVRQNIEVLHHE